MVKVTLGLEVNYEFDVWIMPHNARVDLILGTDFIIPAGKYAWLYTKQKSNYLTKSWFHCYDRQKIPTMFCMGTKLVADRLKRWISGNGGSRISSSNENNLVRQPTKGG